ncbi:MAG: hypothetical protein ABIE84_01615 [bacterium]
MYEILINVLVFSAILLLLAITVGVVQLVIVVLDVRRTTKKVTRQVEAVTSIFDIGSLLLGGMEGAGKRISKKVIPGKANITALIAGIKKGLQVLFKNNDEEEIKND